MALRSARMAWRGSPENIKEPSVFICFPASGRPPGGPWGALGVLGVPWVCPGGRLCCGELRVRCAGRNRRNALAVAADSRRLEALAVIAGPELTVRIGAPCPRDAVLIDADAVH